MQRMPKERALILVLLLGSCADRHTLAETYDLADVARANSVNALYKIQQLEDRVEVLESRPG